MNTQNPFEQRLMEVAFRPAPETLRDAVLGAADRRARRDNRNPFFTGLQRLWALAMAAAWTIVLVLRLATPSVAPAASMAKANLDPRPAVEERRALLSALSDESVADRRTGGAAAPRSDVAEPAFGRVGRRAFAACNS
jgi:hypothetical protein